MRTGPERPTSPRQSAWSIGMLTTPVLSSRPQRTRCFARLQSSRTRLARREKREPFVTKKCLDYLWPWGKKSSKLPRRQRGSYHLGSIDLACSKTSSARSCSRHSRSVSRTWAGDVGRRYRRQTRGARSVISHPHPTIVQCWAWF